MTRTMAKKTTIFTLDMRAGALPAFVLRTCGSSAVRAFSPHHASYVQDFRAAAMKNAPAMGAAIK